MSSVSTTLPVRASTTIYPALVTASPSYSVRSLARISTGMDRRRTRTPSRTRTLQSERYSGISKFAAMASSAAASPPVAITSPAAKPSPTVYVATPRFASPPTSFPVAPKTTLAPSARDTFSPPPSARVKATVPDSTDSESGSEARDMRPGPSFVKAAPAP